MGLTIIHDDSMEQYEQPEVVTELVTSIVDNLRKTTRVRISDIDFAYSYAFLDTGDSLPDHTMEQSFVAQIYFNPPHQNDLKEGEARSGRQACLKYALELYRHLYPHWPKEAVTVKGYKVQFFHPLKDHMALTQRFIEVPYGIKPYLSVV